MRWTDAGEVEVVEWPAPPPPPELEVVLVLDEEPHPHSARTPHTSAPANVAALTRPMLAAPRSGAGEHLHSPVSP